MQRICLCISSPQDVINAMNVNPRISFPPEVDFVLISTLIRETCRVAFAMQTLDPPLDLAFASDGELYNDSKSVLCAVLCLNSVSGQTITVKHHPMNCSISLRLFAVSTSRCHPQHLDDTHKYSQLSLTVLPYCTSLSDRYRRSYDSEFTAPLVMYHVWPALLERDAVVVKGEAVTRRGALVPTVKYFKNVLL